PWSHLLRAGLLTPVYHFQSGTEQRYYFGAFGCGQLLRCFASSVRQASRLRAGPSRALHAVSSVAGADRDAVARLLAFRRRANQKKKARSVQAPGHGESRTVLCRCRSGREVMRWPIGSNGSNGSAEKVGLQGAAISTASGTPSTCTRSTP